MDSVIKAVGKISGVNKIKHEMIGLRPGEKIHEDMLADTELDFTYHATENLLAVLPQYTMRSHEYSKKYLDKELNSAYHIDNDIDSLTSLIQRGLEESLLEK
jgi:FlaA1/EpsC-like NDP-sugar epimerase